MNNDQQIFGRAALLFITGYVIASGRLPSLRPFLGSIGTDLGSLALSRFIENFERREPLKRQAV